MTYDLAILGGGPAGVAAGVYAARKRLKTVFVTKDFESQSVVSTDIQNWIGTPNSPIEEASFVPPSPFELQDHLNHWEAYWHSDAPDVLVQLALVHAQFEILHPFIDGNGRLGRMEVWVTAYTG